MLNLYYAEFDTLTGSRIAAIEINSPVVRMAYSPTSSHAIVAILEVGTDHTNIFYAEIVDSFLLIFNTFCSL